MNRNRSLRPWAKPAVCGAGPLMTHSTPLSTQYMDRTNPMDRHMEVMINRYGMVPAPAAAQMFGNAGREHMEKYGERSPPDVFLHGRFYLLALISVTSAEARLLTVPCLLLGCQAQSAKATVVE